MFFDHILSETEPVKPRPILCQLIDLWMSVIPKLVISGTDIFMEEMEPFIGSAIVKQSSFPSITITDTGAFNDTKSQFAYLEKYLPKGYLRTEEGKVVASRTGYWLHGRCVCKWPSLTSED
jgi:hypothetical protein